MCNTFLFFILNISFISCLVLQLYYTSSVFLSSAELAELQTELPSLWEQYIERLSEYMESSGKGYKNHAATIRRWANADKKKEEPPARNRDYSVEEGETI